MHDRLRKSDETAERLQSLYALAAVAAAALACGGAAAAAVYFWAPLSDPVDVVGMPLLMGYVEANEQWAFFAFFAIASACGAGFARLRRGANRFLAPVGALSLLGLACAPGWSENVVALLPATLVGVAGFWLGAQGRLAAVLASGWCAILTLTVWAIAFPELPLALVESTPVAAILTLGVVGWLWLRTRGSSTTRDSCRAGLRLGASATVVVGMLTANAPVLAQGLAAAGAFWLGVGARRLTGIASACAFGPRQSPFVHTNWLLVVALLAGVLVFIEDWWMLPSCRPVLAAVGGLGAAIVLRQGATVIAEAAAGRSALGTRQLAHLPGPVHCNEATCCGRAPRWVRPDNWRWLIVAGIAVSTLGRPWFGLAAALLAMWIWVIRWPRRRRAAIGCAAAALLIVFLPAPPPKQIDLFHDGQIISAVWSFENGKALYSEVFPLRGFDFFATWLGRQIAGPTVAAHQRTHQALTYLPLAGLALAVYAWTRSVPWSIASAFVLSTFWAAGGRMGLQLLLAALGIAAFRSRSRRRQLWLATAGVPAAFAGYDVLVPYATATVAASALAFQRSKRRTPAGSTPEPADPGSPNDVSTWQRRTSTAVRAAGRATCALAGITVPFTVVVAAWQGIGPACAYWRLLADNARCLPAFYGLPLPWDSPDARTSIVAVLSIVGLWGVVLGGIWRQLSAAVRTSGVFLFVQAVLMLCRGVGRSDFAHLHVAVYPAVLLGSIGAFELLGWLRRQGICRRIDRSLVAGFATVIASWWTPLGTIGLAAVLADLRQTPAADDALLPQPQVAERLTAEDTLWDIESGHLNHVYRRHNPTRHAIAYCISSPAEQRRAVAAMRQNPPKLIAWQYLSGSDGIANPLRYFVISSYLFADYRPSLALGAWLEPAPADWTGIAEVPQAFTDVLHTGWLPSRWGTDRMDDMRRRTLEERPLGDWLPVADRSDAGREPDPRAGWISRGVAIPRGFNYLKLDVAAGDAEAGSAVEAVLEFAGLGQELRAEDRIVFYLRTDGVRRPYLLPVGCSPGWSWRPSIDTLRLSVPRGAFLTWPTAAVWRVDELRD